MKLPTATPGIFLLTMTNRLLRSPLNFCLTLFCAGLIYLIIPPVLNWAVFEAVWHGTAEQCRQADGACWVFVGAKARFFVYGFYAPALQWRPTVAMTIMVALMSVSLLRRLWGPQLGLIWVLGVALAVWLSLGGWLLRPIPVEMVGGLPLTMMLAFITVPLGFPIGLLLALGRRSDSAWISWPCTFYVELFRGTPLIAVLFSASVMVPFFMPEGITPPKLMRACVAFVLIAAAYAAEAIRGGLQAVTPSQSEAGRALGLTSPQVIRLIVLPQALRHAIPGLVTITITFFKETSLVSVIGMSDLLRAVRVGAQDAQWLGFDIEGLVVAGAIYFVFCYVFSGIARKLEKR